MDLEMTGLDPVHDRILEVACIVTDWDFTETASYTAVVKVDDAVLQDRMVGAFWDEFAGVREQLIAQNATGTSAEAVENELLAFINAHIGEEKVLLAGNSIHQDRRFIASEWQRLDARLHYRMLDVSAWKIVFESKYKRKFAKPEAHRALDDIRGSIEELRYYLKRVQDK